jgi:hypothetical protein
MISKDLTDGRISDIEVKAKSYFTVLYTNKDSTVLSDNIHVTYLPKDTTTGTSQVVISGSGYVTSDFMKIAGFPQLNFNTGATATWGYSRMRVAMVLDNTGSMDQNGKMPAMQTAAKDMIDTLAGYNKQDGRRRLYFHCSVREGRQRWNHQRQRVLDQLDGIGG